MKVFDGFAAARGLCDDCAVALGNFDGVHLGHQALFASALSHARERNAMAVAATFDPHPGKILTPDLAPPLLTPLSRRLELMEASGLDAVVVQRFDRAYAAVAADTFLARDLFGLSPRDVVVGSDFTFGKGRAGTIASLRAAAEERGIGCVVVPPVTCDGVVVSSTKIRELVAEGRVAAAARLLGRPFDLTGRVVKGAGRGRSIGFATANLLSANEVRPGIGVYAVRVQVGERVFGGAANLGCKPTFGESEVTIEVHLFDFERDLYGATLRVAFLDRLRGEQRFTSVAELAEQIGRDCEKARQVLARSIFP